MEIKFSSYKLKISLLIVVMTCAVSAITAFISITSIRKSAIEIQAEQSKVLLEQTMKLIDVQKLKYLIETNDEEDPYYIKTCAEMNKLRTITNAKYLYVMTQIEGTKFKYILDGNDINDEEHYSPIGTEEDIDSYGKWPFICLKEQRLITGDVSNQEEWGWASTVYAPIVDNKGKSIAFLACDYDFSNVIAMIKSKTKIITIVSIVTIITCIIVLIIFVNRIFSRMNAVTKSMHSIASGKSDLTMKIPTYSDSEIDQLAIACNAVTDYLQNIIRNIKHSMNTLFDNNKKMTEQNQNIFNSIKTMLEVNNKINTKASAQFDLTTETQKDIATMMNKAQALDVNVENQSQAMNKSSSAVEEISANINTAHQLIQQITDEYKEIVEKTISEQKKQQKITEEIHKIVEEAQSLNDANNMITEIAQRTNLLAMNAAIEASHAGKYGVGFSVVASEIRRLAETSANHSKTIGSVVEEIEQSITQIQQDSIESVNSFGQLGASISNMEQHLDEIKNGMDEQNVGAREILDVMNVLKSCADDVKDTATQIKDECTAVTNTMNQLSKQSNDVKQHTVCSVDILDEIKQLAQEASSQAETNKSLSDQVSSMLANYSV